METITHPTLVQLVAAGAVRGGAGRVGLRGRIGATLKAMAAGAHAPKFIGRPT